MKPGHHADPFRIYTPEGGSTRSVVSRIEFGRINNGQGDVTSIIWTSTSVHPWRYHLCECFLIVIHRDFVQRSEISYSDCQ